MIRASEVDQPMDSSNGRRLAIIRELLNNAESKTKFIQGPDYWVTLPSGIEANLTSILMEDRVHLLCFGVDDDLPDHNLVGELHTDLEDNDDGSLKATGYIETFQRGHQYAVALEIVRQDILQRLSNQSDLIIEQQIIDANKNHMELTSQMRAAWLKLYGKDGYFDFDKEGKKTFKPENKSVIIKDVGSIHILVEKNAENDLIYNTTQERSVKDNPRATKGELKSLLNLLLDPTHVNSQTEDAF